MKNKSASPESKSIRTFFLYTGLVFALIAISLGIKVISLIQQSTYSGNEQYIVAFVKDSHVKEVAVFSPQEDSLSVLKLEGNLSYPAFGRTIGIIPDALIELPSDDILQPNVGDTLASLFWHIKTTRTNLTLFDNARLTLFAKSIPPSSITTESIKLPIETSAIDRVVEGLFIDNVVQREGISVQIINASGIPGMAGRLERVMDHMGVNVVSVITGRDQRTKSSIAYYEKDSYTLQKIEGLLSYPLHQQKNETIADIVITIGEDQKGTKLF